MSETEMSCGVPIKRIVVKNEAVPFIARGGRVFSRQVMSFDLGVENGDIVQIVDRKNNLLAMAEVSITQ